MKNPDQTIQPIRKAGSGQGHVGRVISRANLTSYLPRSLFIRAILILFIPLTVVQVSVSVGIMQRMYEDLTNQLTQNVSEKIDLVLDTFLADGDYNKAAVALGIEVATDDWSIENSSLALDYSARVAARVLYERFPTLSAIDVYSERGRILMSYDTEKGRVILNLDRRQVTASNPHQLLVLVAGLSMFMMLVTWFFLAQQIKPLKKLEDVADAYGCGQIKDYRATGPSEVRAVGDVFLTMRERIEQHKAQRNLLLTGVSHDLRTPLTRLKLEASMSASPDDGQRILADIIEMEGLIDRFLEFVRTELHEEDTQFDLADMLQELVDQTQAGGANVHFGEMPARHVQISTKKTALERALRHLINNAANYGNRTEISLKIENGISVAVEDDGPGIPPELYAEALKPFSRLDPSRNQNSGIGVGLGLSIAANSVRVCGGTLRLGDSDTLQGLSATITLPFSNSQ